MKPKFLEAMYENKLEFPGGRDGAKQKTFHGGVWILSANAQCLQSHMRTITTQANGCLGK